MLFPYRDENPTRHAAVVTIAIIAACSLVFLYQLTLPPRAEEAFVLGFGMIPAVLLGDASLPSEIAQAAPVITMLTSMFLHGGFMHLAGNMVFLWVFGNNIEDAMGQARFIAFYLLCGLAAAMTQAFAEPDSTAPMIGASGAISGVLGAYLLLHPYARVRCLLFLGIFITTLNLPAGIVLGWWAVVQVINIMLAEPGQGGVAWYAHLGGLLAGMALIPFFRDPQIPLFGGARRLGPWG